MPRAKTREVEVRAVVASLKVILSADLNDLLSANVEMRSLAASLFHRLASQDGQLPSPVSFDLTAVQRPIRQFLLQLLTACDFLSTGETPKVIEFASNPRKRGRSDDEEIQNRAWQTLTDRSYGLKYKEWQQGKTDPITDFVRELVEKGNLTTSNEDFVRRAVRRGKKLLALEAKSNQGIAMLVAYAYWKFDRVTSNDIDECVSYLNTPQLKRVLDTAAKYAESLDAKQKEFDRKYGMVRSYEASDQCPAGRSGSADLVCSSAGNLQFGNVLQTPATLTTASSNDVFFGEMFYPHLASGHFVFDTPASTDCGSFNSTGVMGMAEQIESRLQWSTGKFF